MWLDINISKCNFCIISDFKVPCDNGSRCYRLSDRCDRVADCDDGVDELFCASHRTPPSYKCLLTNKCDHLTTTTTTWPFCSGFSCDLGQTCYYESERCDGISKCNDNSDESNCFTDCGSRARCDDGQGCYYSSSRCDDYYDCVDGSDENGCPAGSTGRSDQMPPFHFVHWGLKSNV